MAESDQAPVSDRRLERIQLVAVLSLGLGGLAARIIWTADVNGRGWWMLGIGVALLVMMVATTRRAAAALGTRPGELAAHAFKEMANDVARWLQKLRRR